MVKKKKYKVIKSRKRKKKLVDVNWKTKSL